MRSAARRPAPAYLVVAFVAGVALLAITTEDQRTAPADATAAGAGSEVDVVSATEVVRTPRVEPLADPSAELWNNDEPEASTAPSGEGSTGSVDTPQPQLPPAPPDVGAERRVVRVPSRWPSEIDAVLGRYRLYWEAYAVAFGRPRVDLDPEVLRDLSTDLNWSDLDRQLTAFARDGTVLDRIDDRFDRHRIRLPHDGVLLGEEGDEVVLQDCWFDEFVVGSISDVAPDSASSSALKDAPSVGSAQPTLLNVVMRVENGEWRVHGIRKATSASAGYVDCLELSLEDR